MRARRHRRSTALVPGCTPCARGARALTWPSAVRTPQQRPPARASRSAASGRRSTYSAPATAATRQNACASSPAPNSGASSALVPAPYLPRGARQRLAAVRKGHFDTVYAYVETNHN